MSRTFASGLKEAYRDPNRCRNKRMEPICCIEKRHSSAALHNVAVYSRPIFAVRFGERRCLRRFQGLRSNITSANAAFEADFFRSVGQPLSHPL